MMFKGKKEKKKKEDSSGDLKSGKKKPEPEKDRAKITPTTSSSGKPVEPSADSGPASDLSPEEQLKREEERKKKEEEERRKRREEEKREKEAKAKREEDRRKRREAAERKKAEEARRAAEDEDDEGEIHELESVPVDKTREEIIELWKLFPFGNFPEVFGSYDKLQGFARELNTQIATPEIVVVGFQGHGKSSLIEGFLGQQIMHVGYGTTKRPLYLNIINNVKCEQPKVTIKRDPILKGPEFDHDITVSLGDLPDEVAKRNKVSNVTADPIFVNYEYKYCCNLTLIDTPGLIKEEENAEKEDVKNIILDLVKLPSRLILCVEEAKDWDKLEMPDFAKMVDPEFTRTTFVYTKFHFELQKLTSTRQVNRFLQGGVPDATCFFCTMLSQKLHSKFTAPEEFVEKIYQSVRRDLRSLEQLQYDRSNEKSIGVLEMRQYLLNVTWKRYQEEVPQILRKLRNNKAQLQRSLEKVQHQLENLTHAKMRSIASDYVVEFLQTVDKLLAGTSEGNPAVNGQTLEEEKRQFGDGDWVDSHNRIIKVDPEEWGIPYWDSKLYGGQQFERLLSEFKAVAQNANLPEVTMDDIATAAGINKLNNIPNYAWAASDLAQQKSQEEFIPLLEQTCSRANFVLKRLTTIVEKIMDMRRKCRWDNSNGTVDVNNIDMYPFFTYHVKDLYNKFVDLTSKNMQVKCMDEFYGTRTIFWEYTEYADRKLPMDRSDAEETKRAVDNLAKDLFERLKERITKNVLLKFYNFLLVPMQTSLWSEIQGKVTTLTDEQLDQIFEVNATRNKLEADEKSLILQIKTYSSQESEFIEAATHFSHPLYAEKSHE